MCTVSDKLKLCTCNTKNVEQLKHYWMLRRDTGKKMLVIGIPVFPAGIGEDIEKLNVTTILEQLNSGRCFDVELQHQEDDILKLYFTLDDKMKTDAAPWESNYISYQFRFRNGNWVHEYLDSFELPQIVFTVVQKGKITNPFG